MINVYNMSRNTKKKIFCPTCNNLVTKIDPPKLLLLKLKLKLKLGDITI